MTGAYDPTCILTYLCLVFAIVRVPFGHSLWLRGNGRGGCDVGECEALLFAHGVWSFCSLCSLVPLT